MAQGPNFHLDRNMAVGNTGGNGGGKSLPERQS